MNERAAALAQLAAAAASIRKLDLSLHDALERLQGAPEGLFRLTREGELWRVAYGGRGFCMRDSRGIAFLASLADEPGRPLHVLTLSSPAGDALIDLGGAGPGLDSSAVRAYLSRASELRAAVDVAEGDRDWSAGERAREELEMIECELSRAVRFDGRQRRNGSAVERARINVQRRVKGAMLSIAERDAALGRHLQRTVRTGVFCCYDPER